MDSEYLKILGILAGLIVTLGGIPAWFLRTLLTRTIPALHESHEKQVATVCATIAESATADRAQNMAMHRELLEEMRRQGDRAEVNQRDILEMLRSAPSGNGDGHGHGNSNNDVHSDGDSHAPQWYVGRAATPAAIPAFASAPGSSHPAEKAG